MWKRRLLKLKRLIGLIISADRIIDATHDAIVEQSYSERVARAKNPLNRYGKKSFSQSDEDGITLEICRRIELGDGVYCEYGVGDGLECNTLVLAALGWKGFWLSGQKLAFDLDGIDPVVFRYYREWITSTNVVSLFRNGCRDLGCENPDVISFDLDGNDLSFVDLLLENDARPKLFIVEYNAKFIPPARWSVKPDDMQVWKGTDYVGASLQSFVDMFQKHGYLLVCCNAHTGSNAFFVDGIYADKFSDVPEEIGDIYQPPNYKLLRAYGHTKDPRTVKEIFRRNA